MKLSHDALVAFAETFRTAGLARLDLTGDVGDVRLRLTLEREETAPAGLDWVLAREVARFLPAHPLHGAPAAPPGMAVAEGQTLGFLAVGLLLMPVLAPRAGTVAAHGAAEGALVGYGDPLVALEPP